MNPKSLRKASLLGKHKNLVPRQNSRDRSNKNLASINDDSQLDIGSNAPHIFNNKDNNLDL